MPDNSGFVGPLAVPVDAGLPDAPLVDPGAFVLAHYLAHWLNYALADKLLQMKPYQTPAVPLDKDGLPIVHTFDPGTTFVRLGLPALYVYCKGSKKKPWTMVKELRVAEYHVRYYFAPMSSPQGSNEWSGLTQAIDRVIHAAADDWRHATFPPAALALPVSIPPNGSIEKALCAHAAKLDRVITGMTWESAGQSANTGATIRPNLGSGNDGARQRGFPTAHAVIMVEEFTDVGRATAADERPDIVLSISGASEGDEATHLVDRVLKGPDGTDKQSQKDEDL